jgi:glycerol-3-phosphate dehydrogenase (NAD(P)+)
MERLEGSLPTRIGVLGLGAWGAALALYCARAGYEVTAWHRDQSHIKALQSSGQLQVGKSFATTLPSNLRLTADLAACRDKELTIIALPASAWADVLPKATLDGIVVSASKGIEKTSNTTPLTWAHSTLGLPRKRLCIISGPSFANDLARQTPVTMVSASEDRDTATRVAALLSSKTVRLYPSTDPLGVELGGILKNVIAIAVGISDALAYGPSTRAALITRGLAEMTRVAVALGAKAQTLSGLSGLGDLVMTATDDQSRNRVVGLRLGKGEPLEQILQTLGSTAEGVSSASLVEGIAAKLKIDAPITQLVCKVLRAEIAPQDLATTLMLRPLRDEF